MYSVTVFTAPAVEPVTLTEAKSHARVDSSADDALITAFIIAARAEAESWLRRFIITQTIDFRIDDWPQAACFSRIIKPIYLPGGPIQSLTSVKYYDEDGTLQTLASTAYYVDAYGITPRIVPVSGYSYPIVEAGRPGAVVIRYVTGYGLAAAVPAAIKTAIAMRVADLYEHREARLDSSSAAEDNPTWTALLSPYRIIDFELEG